MLIQLHHIEINQLFNGDNKMKKILATTITMILFGASLVASANGMSIMTFDKDKNGTVSEAEFYEGRNANIAKKAKEGRQMKGLANAKSFGDLDTNGDGQLSEDEIANIQMNHGNRGNGNHK